MKKILLATCFCLMAMAGFSQNGVKREKFYPYASIRYMNISGDNSFIIVLNR